jgi:hypothetical protein
VAQRVSPPTCVHSALGIHRGLPASSKFDLDVVGVGQDDEGIPALSAIGKRSPSNSHSLKTHITTKRPVIVCYNVFHSRTKRIDCAGPHSSQASARRPSGASRHRGLMSSNGTSDWDRHLAHNRRRLPVRSGTVSAHRLHEWSRSVKEGSSQQHSGCPDGVPAAPAPPPG